MKEKDIQQTSLFNYSNLFNVHTDSDGNNFFNLANNILFDDNPDISLYDECVPVGGEEWATMSHRIYGTVELWWLICRFNNVKDATQKPSSFPVLKIPKKEFANMITNQIKYYST